LICSNNCSNHLDVSGVGNRYDPSNANPTTAPATGDFNV
jgi:hypothetical protein